MCNAALDYVVVNGVALTPCIINELDYLQTGGTLNRPPQDRTPDNAGIHRYMEYLDELHNYFVRLMIDDDDDLEQKRELLLRVEWLRGCFNEFKLPEGVKLY